MRDTERAAQMSEGYIGPEGYRNSPCNLCPRECGALRRQGQAGRCLSDDRILVARASLHMWEEPCISGKTGSGTVFFSGCSLRCIYCQNFEIAAARKGRQVTTEELSALFLALEERGAANINLVTPDHYVLEIIEAVQRAKAGGLAIPIVYNCSGYAKEGIIRRLKGIVDIFLTDFKYMEPDLAERFSSAPDYPEVAKRALGAMSETAGSPFFDSEGMMRRGVIVRHLLLPGHKKNARAVIKYVYETFKDGVVLSIMNQYTPMEQPVCKMGCDELLRRVTKREYENVVDYALSLGVRNAFIQEGETAKESFIPDFDEGGIL